MKTISPYLITKLYTWTIRDINEIFDKCFVYNHIENRLEGPSSTFALTLATLIDIWGSIFLDQFGSENYKLGIIKKNVEQVLEMLYRMDPSNYEIFDTSTNKINKDIYQIFRNNLVHDFGKDPKDAEHDLNIDCEGKTINKQDNNRWHINCKKLKEDFLNLLRIELPKLLKMR